jgi:hypothetical protein
VHPINIRPILMGILALCTKVVTTKARYVVLGAAFVVFLVSFWYSFNLKVGDANPGSPILWPDSQYNTDATDINRQFQGSDRMFVVVAGKEKGSLRQPEVLQSMANSSATWKLSLKSAAASRWQTSFPRFVACCAKAIRCTASSATMRTKTAS